MAQYLSFWRPFTRGFLLQHLNEIILSAQVSNNYKTLATFLGRIVNNNYSLKLQVQFLNCNLSLAKIAPNCSNKNRILMLFFYFQFGDSLSYSAAAQYGLEFVDENAVEDISQTVLFLNKVKTTWYLLWSLVSLSVRFCSFPALSIWGGRGRMSFHWKVKQVWITFFLSPDVIFVFVCFFVCLFFFSIRWPWFSRQALIWPFCFLVEQLWSLTRFRVWILWHEMFAPIRHNSTRRWGELYPENKSHFLWYDLYDPLDELLGTVSDI